MNSTLRLLPVWEEDEISHISGSTTVEKLLDQNANELKSIEAG